MEDREDLLEQNRVLRERVERLERALADQSDPIVRALVEHAPGFLHVISPDGRLLATGRTSEGFGSVVGRSMYDFIAPSDHACAKEAVARVCETRRPVVYEMVGYGENGEPDHTWVTRAVPILEDGVVRAIVQIPTDITERVRLQRSLQESEQSMRLAVDAARMGLWRWDASRNTITWDARVCEIFGVSTPPATYEQYIGLVHSSDRHLVDRVVRTALETGVYPTFEHRLSAGDGAADRWVLAAGTVLRDGSGKPTALVGGVLEVTEQKRLAAQLQRAERVEALGQLSAGMAHNFNNLLAAIIPNIELARLDAPERIERSLSAALDASLQARDLIKSLLSLSRRPDLTQVGSSDPGDVVRRLQTLCQLTFPREVELCATVATSLGHVAMSASDLEQVLLNLLLNARDAVLETSGRPRRIDLQVDRARGDTGAHVRVRVRDTGTGMTDAVRKRAFEPFFTTKPPHRGSGLGLANALARVRDAHGTLSCTSEAGVGTTFTLTLPALPAAGADAAPASQTPSGARAGETILVVDDEPLVRSVVTQLLRTEGYQVIEAQSAAEARAVLRQAATAPQLILLDQSMPGETGLEALPSLRELCAVPVILFTGIAMAAPQGVTAVLEKPARSAELYGAVRQALDAGR